jgi:riboflavin synthase
VEKGSIAINGISLTVAKAEPAADGAKEVVVALIPHTYAVTNLHTLQPGDPVNLEVDVLAKYAEERAKKSSDESITELSLIAAGF